MNSDIIVTINEEIAIFLDHLRPVWNARILTEFSYA
jgi:hypothetical protein